MNPFGHDYIVPGDVFCDETVLCMRCGTKISALSYREMPKVNNPQETVNVAHKSHFGNFRMLPVVLYRKGSQSIANLNVCQECIKEIVPEDWSDQIIKQIIRAYQIEIRWAGMPEEAVQAVSRNFADARIVRKLKPDEVTAGRILEGVA